MDAVFARQVSELPTISLVLLWRRTVNLTAYAVVAVALTAVSSLRSARVEILNSRDCPTIFIIDVLNAPSPGR